MELKRPFTEIEWAATPPAVRQYIEMLEKSILHLTQTIADLQGRTEKLEHRINRNSQNSSQPPSTDGPFAKPGRKKKHSKKKKGGQKGHQGHRQEMLKPTKTVVVPPMECVCGCKSIKKGKPFYTHQHIEFPEIELNVTHYILYNGICSDCGKTISAKLLREQSFGYGPRMTALIAELSGIQGASRQSVRQFLNSVLGVPISTGGIQKVIDRASEATKPAYDKMAEMARNENVGYIDETSWYKAGKLQWLWVMATASVAFYLVHPRRSREAFDELVKYWRGILVSDNFKVYQN
jgi:transposase